MPKTSQKNDLSRPHFRATPSRQAASVAALLADVQRLKEFEAATPQTPPPPPDRLLNVRQAAELLTISPAGLRKARRAGRLTGVRRNEKEWGFFESELTRYLNRYNRKAAPAIRRPLLPMPQAQPLAKAA